MRSRYDCVSTELAKAIKSVQGNTVHLVEVGVYAGDRAEAMIRQVQAAGKEARYFGYDLFEGLTPEKNTQEKGKAKLPPSRAAVLQRLTKAYTGKGLKPTLVAGDSKDTLPGIQGHVIFADFIFIDGGHSLDTIESDWHSVEPVVGPDTIVLFDDCYPGDDTVGCFELMCRLGREFLVEPLEPVDDCNGLKIQMVKVTRAKT